jgi:hypothetical protein
MKRLLLSSFFAIAACATGAPEPELDGIEQEADYRSPVGREFDITGEVTITAPDDAKAKELAKAKVESLTRALDERLWKIWPEDDRQSREGIVVMLRSASTMVDGLRAEGEAFRFTYKAEAAGPHDLLTKLPLEEGHTLKVDDVTLKLTPAAQTVDAYPQYLDLFQDGLDIAIHVGGDHYTPRNDLNEARAIYDELGKLGLKSPVAKFEDLALGSGAFTGSLDAVPVRVTLFHADMAPDDKLQDLVDAFKQSAKTADVVVYRGHAGTSLDYSGVVVHYSPRVAIPASEFKSLELPDKYQVFVFDGCETYTGYADKLYEHPKKKANNADVITSVNYGSALVAGESVRAFLRGMLEKTQGTWVPKSWESLLRKINDAKVGRWTPIYGVHGLGDNPKISPLADPASVGKACTKKSDCPGADSLCVRRTSGKLQCGAACTDDAGCPGGTKCVAVRTSKQCLP